METKPLHFDYARCYGSLSTGQSCVDRERCLRFWTMKYDPPETFGYVLALRMSNNTPCEMLIESDDDI